MWIKNIGGVANFMDEMLCKKHKCGIKSGFRFYETQESKPII